MIIKNQFNEIIASKPSVDNIVIYSSVKKYVALNESVKTILIYHDSVVKIDDDYWFADFIVINLTTNEPYVLLENHIHMNKISNDKTELSKYRQIANDEKKMQKKLKELKHKATISSLTFNELVALKKIEKDFLVIKMIKKIRRK